ncbi:MAG: hypothetical protein ABI665_14555 [Vicinamibacterales bacterium]
MGVLLLGTTGRIFAAHPLLDPQMLTRQRTAVRFWLPVYRRLVADASGRAALLRSLTTPVSDTGHSALAPVETYFEDTERYLDGLLAFAPAALGERLRVLPEIRHVQKLDALLRVTFEGGAPRLRYEARRKLYLTKLLFDIDHTRAVRDGRRHQALFEQVLREKLWNDLDRSAIDVLDYRTRFKRERNTGAAVGPADASGPAMGPRSGSILSKMIRSGIGDAHAVPDILGALFIVGNRRQAYALERRLVDALGGPFRWRDRIDTLGSDQDRTRLTAASSSRFQVLKQIVDLLVGDQPDVPPYHFPVEIQIYPLNSYQAMMAGGNDAAHQQYKQRQVLTELLPVLFPEDIFGPHAQA